jgi:TldD protein
MTTREGETHFSRRFGLSDEVLERVIRQGLSAGGDYAEVFAQHSVHDSVGFEDGQVNGALTGVDLGAGVRVVKGDQTGYAFTEELTEGRLAEAARTAASIATGGGAGSAVRLAPVVPLPMLYAQEELWSGTPPAEKIALVQAVGERLMARDPSVVKAAVHFACRDEVVLVANSLGARAEERRPMTYMYASCTAERGGVLESNSCSRSARLGPAMYTPRLLDRIAEEAVKRTLLLFDARVPAAGELPVVLAPASSGILLHEAMGHGFEADFNRKGISIFASMMGRKVAADFVTIVDTGLVPDARGALSMDDEGTPGQETVLVRDGVLVSYLHDRISASHYGVAPTGNGRRQSFRHPPLPRMRVTVMENGPHDPDEIIRSVKKGIYAVDFSNGEVSIGAGDYSFYVKTGYMIEDGRLTAPVKDVNLIGNGPDSLARVVMVGNDKAIDDGTWTCGKDGQSVPVGLGLPTVKISSITVGGVGS